MASFESFDSVRPHRIWEGALARAITGEKLTMALIDIVPNSNVPEHAHENEQLGFVVLGHVTMVIAGDSRTLAQGETYSIPSGVRHSASTGSDGATVIDVFAPVREDWETAPREEPSRGAWPT